MTVTLSITARIQLEVRKIPIGTEFTASDLAQMIGERPDIVGHSLAMRRPAGIIPIEPVKVKNRWGFCYVVKQYRRVST